MPFLRRVACAVVSLLAIGHAQAASSYFYRAKPIALEAPADEAPDAFSFPAVSGAPAGSVQVSARVPLTGHTGVTASVSGDASARIRVCSDAACASATAWSASPVAVPADTLSTRSWIEARVTVGVAGSSAKVVTVSAGTASAQWRVTPVASSIATTTANLPTGWEAEYVPTSTVIGNSYHAQGALNVALLRDNDLNTVAWYYDTSFSDLTVAEHRFSEKFVAAKCFLAWRNNSNRTVSINLQFYGGNEFPKTTVTSKPGINTYNGPCLYTDAQDGVGVAMTDTQGTGITITEFKAGR